MRVMSTSVSTGVRALLRKTMALLLFLVMAFVVVTGLSVPSNAAVDTTGKDVLVFTSDVHNKSGNRSASRLDSWIDNILGIYQDISFMGFCGDMADYNAESAANYWSLTQAVMDVVASKGINCAYTTGNHEYDSGAFNSQSAEIKAKFTLNAEADEGENYRIYCLGSMTSQDSTGYTSAQATTLASYLNSVGNDKPIIILTHFPLHYSTSRQIGGTANVISALNAAAESGKTIVFLWGHNHTNANTTEYNYDQVFKPGDSIQTSSSASTEIKFFYAAAGCMSGSEYSNGSAAVQGKGLVIVADDQDTNGNGLLDLEFDYYTESGGVGASYNDADYATYRLTNKLEAGKQYVLVSANEAGRAYALKNPGGTTNGTQPTALAVALTLSEHGVDLDAGTDAADLVWTAEANGSGFNLKNAETYLEINAQNSSSANALYFYSRLAHTGQYWTYQDNALSCTAGGNAYKLYYSGSDATFKANYEAGNTQKVYLFERVSYISNETIPVSGIALSTQTLSVAVGEDAQLRAMLAPVNATNRSVSWSSSNNAIARISQAGVVTGVAKGSATITASTPDGSFSASCEVHVTAAPSKIYTLATSIVDGKNYLIVNANSAGSAQAVSHNGTSIASDAVTIKSNAAVSDALYIEPRDVDAASVWTVHGSSSYYFSNGGYNFGIERSGYSNSLSISTNEPTYKFTWQNNLLYYSWTYLHYNNGWTTTYSSSNATKIYFFEESAPKCQHEWAFTSFEWGVNNAAVAAYECSECGAYESVSAEITSSETSATCDAGGQITYTATVSATSSLDGQAHSDTKVVPTPPSGHDWTKVYYEWAEDYRSVTAIRTCDNDETHVETETVNTSAVVTQPTCTEDGFTTYTSDAFENEDFEIQTLVVPGESATGHEWTKVSYDWADDYSTLTATRSCENDPTHVETETVRATGQVTAPFSCTEAGEYTVSSNSFINDAFEAQTLVIPIPATGHDWNKVNYLWAEDYSSVTAWRECENDPTHVESETVSTTAVTTQPTCTQAGSTTYTSAVFTNSAFEVQTKTVAIPATGHDWNKVNYSWAADNSSVTATRVCENDETHVETETARTTSVTTQPTCTEAGSITYTSRSFRNSAFEVQTKTVEGSPATGHAWSQVTYTWAADNSSVTARRVCSNNPAHVETETVSATAVTTQPTCTEAGSVVYTSAAFTNPAFAVQTKTTTIPATGHDWTKVAYIWAEDNSTVTATRSCENDPTHIETETVNTTAVTTQPTCTQAGSITFTSASFSNPAFAVQTKTVAGDSATGHAWSEVTYTWASNFGSVTATRTCEHDSSHVETETVRTTSVTTQPTCTQAGATTYTSRAFRNSAFEVQTTSVTIPATGHTPANAVTENAVAASCTQNGSYDVVVYCSSCHEELSRDTVTVNATGHAWKLDGWAWASDYSSATATFVCEHDATHCEQLTDTQPSLVVNADGSKTYTATVTFGTTTYTDTQTVKHAAGWAYENNWYYYYNDDGTLRTNNWAWYGDSYFYLGSDGRLIVNYWVQHYGSWYYMGKDGKPVVNNWVVWYNGSYNDYYYFGADGKLVTDSFVDYAGATYYVRANGTLAANSWVIHNGQYYYVGSDAKMVRDNWVVYYSSYYYMKADGTPVINDNVMYEGVLYHFGADGKCTGVA